jgi:hypothetical protein
MVQLFEERVIITIFSVMLKLRTVVVAILNFRSTKDSEGRGQLKKKN